jgi:hypothetical protein
LLLELRVAARRVVDAIEEIEALRRQLIDQRKAQRVLGTQRPKERSSRGDEQI